MHSLALPLKSAFQQFLRFGKKKKKRKHGISYSKWKYKRIYQSYVEFEKLSNEQKREPEFSHPYSYKKH